MKASAFEFKFRFPIIVAICVIGFVAPWNYWLHLDAVRTWQWVAARLSRTGLVGFSRATDAVLVAGIVVAAVAALLRTWGSYRSLRNAQDLGTFLNVVAISLLMLPSGAVFTIVLVGFFLWWVRGAGERAAEVQVRSPWWQAFVGEIYSWGVVVSFAALGWRYNALPIIQGVIVSLGLSIVVRQFLPKR
jgi:hypothetical protein